MLKGVPTVASGNSVIKPLLVSTLVNVPLASQVTISASTVPQSANARSMLECSLPAATRVAPAIFWGAGKLPASNSTVHAASVSRQLRMFSVMFAFP